MDGWEYPRRKARAYHVCKGCTNSWIWSDRISSTRWGCTKCGAAWPQSNGNWRTDWSPKKKANLRGRPRHQVAPPPGLGGKTKQQKSEVEQTLRQAWSSLPTECQQALKGMGLDFTPEPEPQPLEELLKAHLESLPKEVKEVVEGLLKPAPAASVDVTGQLKATVGELRQLTTKKQSLQKRVDQAKESYKMLLDELKIVQEAIDKEHKQLGNQSEAYAKQLKEEALPTTPPAEHVLDPDTTEHVMKAMGQAGIIFTVEQQKELERNLAETIAKRRKTVGDAQLSG